MAVSPGIRFSSQQRSFFQTLHGRVDEYFKTNNLSKNGNGWMTVKTIAMFCLYFSPYFLIVFGVVTSVPLMLGLCVMMGFGIAGIGLAVMHDANHGSYSSNSKVNMLIGYSLNLIGGHYLNWQLQHNTLHHTFTNIHEHDEDIEGKGLLRFSPHSPYKKIFRFQFLYAWFFYGLLTLSWVVMKDYKQLIRYNKMGMLKARKKNFTNQFIALVAWKLFYLAYMIGIPMLVLPIAWWQILLGFVIIHFTGGLILGMVFQPAHVVEDLNFPLPDESGNIENDWAVHQLYTTANFAPKARVLSWFVGGLNYQVEHHLFPSICHQHYKHIAPIVQRTAQEFNYPYHTHRTFRGALVSHTRMLIKFGKRP
ncbi:MAG TPA: acyl-CoA desaturase [Bacteroidia bacterium]|nr:acyl-CoA desaturase [Bacteroidia bacterium]